MRHSPSNQSVAADRAGVAVLAIRKWPGARPAVYEQAVAKSERVGSKGIWIEPSVRRHALGRRLVAQAERLIELAQPVDVLPAMTVDRSAMNDDTSLTANEVGRGRTCSYKWP